MATMDPSSLAEAAIGRALALGAHSAGVAAWADLAAAPSYRIQDSIGPWIGRGSGDGGQGPEPAPGSLLIIGLAHPASRPELDWWHDDLPRRTMGNELLAGIGGGVARWLGRQCLVRAWDLPFFPWRGGVYLKDAAVLAGMGCVGRNNLFLAPRYGPRIRLRAVAMEPVLPSSGQSAFDPCTGCHEPCRKVCPQRSMARPWLENLSGLQALPGRDGAFDRMLCNRQMEADMAAHRLCRLPGRAQPGKQVRYCRRCELVCVAGKQMYPEH